MQETRNLRVSWFSLDVASVSNGEYIVDLKQFVPATLQQIIDGVVDAQNTSRATARLILTYGCIQREEAAARGILESNTENWIHMVRFDVAVTVAESAGVTGGAKKRGG